MLKYFAFLFLLTLSIPAQNNYETSLEKGISFSYNLNYSASSKIFKSLIENHPENPAAYHFLSKDYLYKYLGSGEEKDFENFQNYSEITIKKSEKILDDNSDDTFTRFILGSSKFLRAVAYSYKGKNLDAFWAAKSAKGNLEDVIDDDPNFYDAYLGIGALKYALSEMSGIYNLALKLTRLSGNKDEGLDLVKTAYEKGKLNKPEAAFHLSKIYNDYLAFYDEASSVLEKNIEAYPENVLFLYQYAIAKMNNHKLNEAENVLKKIIELNNPDFKQTNSFSYFLLGDIYFKKNNFENAVSYYEQFLKTTNELSYTGSANLRIGISYLFLQNTIKAKKHFLAARNGNKDIKEDNLAKAKSEKLFEKGLSKEEKKLILNKHKIEAGNYQSAYDELNDEFFSNPELDLIRKTYTSLALFYLKKYDASLELIKKVLNFSDEDDDIYVLAQYIAAVDYFKKEEIKSAEKILDDIEIKENLEDGEKLKAKVNGLKRKIKSAAENS